MMNVCIYGLGYIGLPTAALVANVGFQVLGVDLREDVVDAVNAGRAPHAGEAGLPELLASAVASGRLEAATSGAPADIHMITVGTPVGAAKEPDLSQVISATRAVAEVVRPGDLVIVESTVPPSTCERLVGELIAEATGLDHRTDYGLAHCPERVLPGQLLHELINSDRVIGGTTPDATKRTAAFYSHFAKGELLQTTAATAELCKVMENTYRDVNIALANALADVAMTYGVDIEEAISICNRHPRVNLHTPGIGVGGHCIPVDPWFLIQNEVESTQLLRMARQINDGRPHHVAEAIMRIVEAGGYRDVALLGLTYKANVDDMRESPALQIATLVAQALGRPLMVVEPHAEQLPPGLDDPLTIRLVDLETAIRSADVLFRLVPHQEFSVLERTPSAPRTVEVRDLIGAAQPEPVHGNPT